MLLDNDTDKEADTDTDKEAGKDTDKDKRCRQTKANLILSKTAAVPVFGLK